MTLAELIRATPTTTAALYLFLLLLLFLRRHKKAEGHVRWLFLFVAASSVWQALVDILSLPDNTIHPLPFKAFLAATLALTLSTFNFLNRPLPRWLIPTGIASLVLLFLGDLLLPAALLPQLPSLRIDPTLSTLIGLAGWLLLSLFNIGLTLRDYRRTAYPWLANRNLYWANALLFVLAGEIFLFFSGTPFLWLGHLLRLLGSIGLVYATTFYIRFDVRTRFRRVIGMSIVALSAALPATAVYFLISSLSQRFSNLYIAGLVIIVTTLAFIIYLPYRHAIERLVTRFLIGDDFHTEDILRRYSQAVSRTLDVEQLSSVMINTMRELFGAQRGALLLVSRTALGYTITPVPALGNIPPEPHTFPHENLLLHRLRTQHQPLLQYEIDYNPDLAPIKEADGGWLAALEMELVVPITADSGLNGLIALGPKQSGRTYLPSELSLIQLLADQSTIALQNARLYSELGRQNVQVQKLNEDLKAQNEKLEMTDKVKSDFITIASHELRTPLTQIKGYADILAAMNEEDALTREQTRVIVGHINRATLQLEDLLAAMLDASQIEVEEMVLSFVETRINMLLRLAYEPLAAAIRERRLQLVLDGIEDLPPVLGDVRRLTQAFVNLLSNAVKYTPDGGKISIQGSQISDASGEPFIQVAISDNGIGLDPKYHELVFEKFFRVGDPHLHSTGSTKFMGAGPGLGLPIAKGVIEGHGGRLWLESEGENHDTLPGTTFYVLLPLRPSDEIIAKSNGRLNGSGERPLWLIG